MAHSLCKSIQTVLSVHVPYLRHPFHEHLTHNSPWIPLNDRLAASCVTGGTLATAQLACIPRGLKGQQHQTFLHHYSELEGVGSPSSLVAKETSLLSLSTRMLVSKGKYWSHCPPPAQRSHTAPDKTMEGSEYTKWKSTYHFPSYFKVTNDNKISF